jgi:hypothetical protein
MNLLRHCERSEAIQCGEAVLDCFVAALLAMTGLPALELSLKILVPLQLTFSHFDHI